MTDETTAGADAAPAREDLVADAIKLAFEDEEPKPRATEPEAPEPKAEPTPDPEPAAPTAGEEKDIWADAPDVLRSAYQAQTQEFTKLRETWERQRNQTAGLSRKIEELQRKLDAKGEKPAAEAPPATTFESVEEKLASLRDEFPDIAGPVDALADLIRAQEARISGITAAQVAAASRDAATEASKVEDKHAGWFEFITKEKANEWAAFVNDPDQPYWVHQAAVMNGEEIVDAASAIRLLDAFKKHLNPSDPPPKPQTQTDEWRRRQLAGAASPPPRSAGAVTAGAPANADRDTLKRWAIEQAFKD